MSCRDRRNQAYYQQGYNNQAAAPATNGNVLPGARNTAAASWVPDTAASLPGTVYPEVPQVLPDTVYPDVAAPLPAPAPETVYPDAAAPLPETLTEYIYTPGFLRSQIGKLMRVEFLISNNTTDRVGVLEEVGASYIVLNALETGSRVMCDLYSIKFVTIIDSQLEEAIWGI